MTSKGRFPLLEKLDSGGRPVKGDFFRAYSVGESPSIDRDQITYFATSIFWRASVHIWKQEDGALVFVTIPLGHRDALRRYLLGLEAFPKDAALFMIVCTDPESQNMFVMPGDNVKNAGGWVVIMRGLMLWAVCSAYGRAGRRGNLCPSARRTKAAAQTSPLGDFNKARLRTRSAP
jgi:hypothetical protein